MSGLDVMNGIYILDWLGLLNLTLLPNRYQFIIYMTDRPFLKYK